MSAKTRWPGHFILSTTDKLWKCKSVRRRDGPNTIMRVILNWMRWWRWNAEHCIITNYWSQHRGPAWKITESLSNHNFKTFTNPEFSLSDEFFTSSIEISGESKKWFVSEVLWSRSEAVTSVTWVTGTAWHGSRDIWCGWHLSLNIPVTTVSPESGARRRQLAEEADWRACGFAEGNARLGLSASWENCEKLTLLLRVTSG